MDDGVNLSMPVTPAYGGNGGFGFGNGGGDWAWLLLLLIAFGGGWGNGFGGGFGGNDIYPWMNQSNQISGGFRDSMLNTGITSIGDKITSGLGDIQTALCGGFAGVTASVVGAQNAIASQLYSNQLADLERSFSAQTAVTSGLTGLSSQLSQCCCDNRLATCQTQNIVATEGAATRLAIQEQTQAILDKMCQQEIDNLKAQNLALQNQVNMQNLAASQAAQTAALVADNTAQTQYIVNRVAPYPIPAYVVANPVTPVTPVV
jgi:hypothetical protein